MCGFCAIASKKENRIKKADLEKMLKSISHRGPDSQNYLTLDNFSGGFARLSIIDIHKRSNQPFHDQNSYILFFNGEIYNYKQIKSHLVQKGHKFYTFTKSISCFLGTKIQQNIAQMSYDFIQDPSMRAIEPLESIDQVLNSPGERKKFLEESELPELCTTQPRLHQVLDTLH